MIRVEVTPTSLKRFQSHLEGASAERAYDDAVWLARRMEEECVRIVEAKFNNDRGPEDRKANTIKLINSFQGRVDGVRGQMPVSSILGIKRGANEKKIAAIEFGVDHDYVIAPGRVSAQARRAGLAGLRGVAKTKLRWYDYEKGKDRYAPQVTHKAFRGTHMMRDARRNAVRDLNQRNSA